ncbi:MAG TPA: hypothetical protein VLX92_22590 [Kofleriaceae bacterium]|nr:hypothetical protein [Kofleriaceae bacterium]
MTAYRHSPTTRAVLRSLVPVICPPEAAPLRDAIVDHLALTIGVLPSGLQRGFAAGLRTYDLGALPRYLRLAHALPPARAEAYFAWWERGAGLQRQLARAVNQLMSLACYEQPAIMEAIGYRPGPWIEAMRHKRLAVYGDDVRAQEAQILAPDPLRPRSKRPRVTEPSGDARSASDGVA